MEKRPDYKYLIEKFSESVIKERYTNMERRALEFIKISGLEEKVVLNHEILNIVMLDYFTDLDRLKGFEGIERANKNKISAYMSYWWLRRKPLQIIGDVLGQEELVYINEKFIATFISKDFMYENRRKVLSNKKCQKCIEHIYYHLKYRLYTPQTLELLLMGIDTGIEIGNMS